MQLTIHGPNLRGGPAQTFHVHTAACSDNAREVKRYGSVEPITVDLDSVAEVVDLMYSDHIGEAEGELAYYRDHPEEAAAHGYTPERLAAGVDLNPYFGDFHFSPCVKNLPTHTPNTEDPNMTAVTDETKTAADETIAAELETPEMAAALKAAEAEAKKPAAKKRSTKAKPASPITGEIVLAEAAKAARRQDAAKKRTTAKPAAKKTAAKETFEIDLSKVKLNRGTKAKIKKLADDAKWPSKVRATGTTVALFSNKDGAFDPSEDLPWVTACLDHGAVSFHANSRAASYWRARPQDWCPICSNPEAEAAAS